jgi:hypothetical protein
VKRHGKTGHTSAKCISPQAPLSRSALELPYGVHTKVWENSQGAVRHAVS